MFSECITFPIRDGGVYTVVGSGEDADVRLAGDDVLPRHAVIRHRPGNAAALVGGAVLVVVALLGKSFYDLFDPTNEGGLL